MKAVEEAAAKAAVDGTVQIEQALAEAANKSGNVVEVAELRARLWEEQTAAAAATAERDALAQQLAEVRAQLDGARG